MNRPQEVYQIGGLRFSQNSVAFLFLFAFSVLFVAIYLQPPFLFAPVCGDEVFRGNVALDLLQNKGQFPGAFKLFGRIFYLGLGGHLHGAVESYALLPLMFFWPGSETALRIAYLLGALLTFLTTYLLASAWFNRSVAVMTVALLILNGAFLEMTWQGGYFGSLLPLVTTSTLLLFTKWYQKRSLIACLGGFICLSIGLLIKTWFLCFYFFIFISFLVMWRQKKISHGQGFAGLLLFAVSISLLVFLMTRPNYYFHTMLFSGRPLMRELIQEIFIRLKIRFEQVYGLLVAMVSQECDVPIMPPRRTLSGLSALFILSALWQAFTGKVSDAKRILFLFALCLSILLFSTFKVTDLRQGHLLILFPYLQLIMAIGIWGMYRECSGRFLRVTVMAGLCLFLLLHLGALSQKYFGYRQIREWQKGTTAQDIMKTIDLTKFTKLYVFDFHLYNELMFLSKLALPLDYSYTPDTTDEMRTRSIRLLLERRQENGLFIFGHLQEQDKVESEFVRQVQMSGDTPVLFKMFNFPDKTSRYKFYTISQGPRIGSA